jgi:hypothetical protein
MRSLLSISLVGLAVSLSHTALAPAARADTPPQRELRAEAEGMPNQDRSLRARERARPAQPRGPQARRCSDGRDNDGDGLTDYPADPGCRRPRDPNERHSPPERNCDPHSIPVGAGVNLGDCRPFPDNNPWNQDISGLPVDPESDVLLASVGLRARLHPDFGTVWEGKPIGLPFAVVDGAQPRVPVTFDYAEESDPGPYPIPHWAPIEGGAGSNGDRHVIVIDRARWRLYEMFYAFKTDYGWHATSGAIFDLASNHHRPAGWTSADAAGLPIFPGLVRYEEVYDRGVIRHALRFTAPMTRRAYLWPARHWASWFDDPSLPPMGMRVRLKASYDISGLPYSVRVVLSALKKYGMILADNGAPWFITGAPDPRWNDWELHFIGKVRGRDLEVVKMGRLVTP